MNADRLSPQGSEADNTSRQPGTAQFIAKACISLVVLMAGLGVLLFGTGDPSDTALAAGGVGVIFGHWLR